VRTNADRQSNQGDRHVNDTRIAASTRFGFTPRSQYNANWRRRNRISGLQRLARPQHEAAPLEQIPRQSNDDGERTLHDVIMPSLRKLAAPEAKIEFFRTTVALSQDGTSFMQQTAT
jgi:hypothetical protein